MIAKLNTGSSLFGALSYNQEKVDRNEGKILFSNRIIQEIDGSYSMRGVMKSFEPYLDANKNTEKPIVHISLNPHPDDKLSNEQLSEIAQEYMEKMGYGNQPYLVYKHEDIDRHHIHIVSIKVDEQGKKLNDSFEKRRSEEVRKGIEEKYKLIPAQSQKQTSSLPLKPIDIKAGDIKKQVSNTVKALMKTYRFHSIYEYRALLSVYGLTVEEVKGEAKGKPYHGLVYSVIDRKGNKVGNPFKSSLLGKDTGVIALNKQIENSKKKTKEQATTKRARDIVSGVLNEKPNRKQFESALSKNNISVVFRENDDKRIYGVTFIDHESKSVFNGSKLGKEFSANTFQELFNGSADKHLSDDKSQDDFTFQQDSPVEAMAGLFAMEQHGDNYEEIAFANRMKRKKKRKGRQF